MRNHVQHGGDNGLQDLPWEEDDSPFDALPDADELWHVYETNQAHILRHHDLSDPISKIYNFPVANVITPEDITQQMELIYEDRQRAYTINLSIGCILEEDEGETTRFVYFIPGLNETVFRQPVKISSRNRFDIVLEDLLDIDIVDVTLNRETTKFKPDLSLRCNITSR